ncbi:MAG TPA: hypothetical protein PKZ32_13265 [Candidatus Melainabacteria bacterium]|nr:hypothetical protein [Candidatus Melainabacteria bacterium]
MQINSRRFQVCLLLISSLLLSHVKSVTAKKIAAPAKKIDASRNASNFFSPDEEEQNSLPKYKNETKPGERIRLYIQAGTPELEQVKLIGSLKGKQREDIIKIYGKERAEFTVINQEFLLLKKKMSPVLIEKMLSKEEPQMDAMTKYDDFELLLKSRSILQDMRSKKLSLWEQIQAKLSPSQLEELEKLKSGEIPTDLHE